MSRIYDFSYDSILEIEPIKRKVLLKKMLDEAVYKEYYEEAAILRDTINLI